MTEKLTRDAGGAVDDIIAEMRRTFLDEAADTLRALELVVEDARHDRLPQADMVHRVRTDAVSLRGQAANLGLSLIATVAARLEDYPVGTRQLPPRGFDDMEVFIETLLDIVEGRISMDTEAAALVRKLPPKAGFRVGDIEVRDVEVLLVMPYGAAAHFVERELQQCGYRTHTIGNTFDALSIIVRTKPDLVIVGAVMPDLSGIDLVMGLHAMPQTRNIPTALITSLPPEDDYLKLLPPDVPVIHKGAQFGDDLADALDRLFLI
ncbi:Hpt domain-containing protein [Caenispirillum salinarum]|uniref:Hpt domain-containing protein n=1 Tax=Caenispirillum salinarum TaxID=859058 RepID=UPI00384C4496